MTPHDMLPNTAWEVVQPGVIRLPTTEIEIHLLEDWSRFARYEVRWRDRVIATSMVLGHAKIQAQEWMAELLAMGLEPG